jgi:anti-sigma regulatory factor (Ser/Thr protein kinase)
MSLPERQSGGGASSPQRVELKITSDAANLREVRKQLEQFAQRAQWPREAAEAVGLVVNEALANVIRHGYGGASDRPIVVTAEALPRELRISIRDWAKPFDPATVAQPQAGELRPGGLGLLCMRQLMDDVRHERLPDGNLLTLIKKGPPV